MHATHAIDVKNVVIDAALEQGKLSWRHPSSTIEISMENAVKNFLKNIKYFVFKNTMLFVKI